MIVLVARYFGKPGTGEAVEQALKRMAPLVRQAEPGCRSYQACRRQDAPDEWLLYEVYEDRAALEAHRQTAHFKAIIEGEVAPLLEHRERLVFDLVIE